MCYILLYISFSISKGILLKNQNLETRLPGNIRNFRRGKINREEPKVNPESLATPFTNVAVDSTNLHTGKLVKPFLFTIGVCLLNSAFELFTL